MIAEDLELKKFEETGVPAPDFEGDACYTSNAGARIWHISYGTGFPVVMLHGGLGHSGNWGYQVRPLVEAGYRVILIDSRGHGRSTRDAQPYSYELMASDVLAVMNEREIAKAAIVGWSDGACTALVLASQAPERVSGVIFFACNMDPSGTKEFVATPIVNRCFARHEKDYAQLSQTPGQFKSFVDAVSLMMATQPNYSSQDLSRISVPVVIMQGKNDEFIKFEHAEYLARTIPDAELVALKEVSHFAPLQKPDYFNAEVLKHLRKFKDGAA